jgi:hypothetical protein
MTNKQLILIHAACPFSSIKNEFSTAKWVFFGKSYITRMQWEAILGRAHKINYKQPLTEISYAIRDKYVSWVANLGRPHWKHWEWWITQLASRSNLTSPLYLHVCYLEVLKKLLHDASSSIIVVSESWELMDAISDNWQGKMRVIWPHFLTQNLRRMRYRLRKICSVPLLWIKYFLRSYWQWLMARLTRLLFPSKWDCVFDPKHVVIHTCIDNAGIGTDGTFKDRYYPELASYLREKGFKVSTLVWIYNVNKWPLFQVFRWFRINREPFLIPQDYYGLCDCFFSCLAVLRSSAFYFNKADCFFDDLDLSALINAEQRLQVENVGAAYFVNQIKLFEKWRSKGYCLHTYVDTWELRFCEIPASMAIKRFYPSCKTIAYQHGALMPKLLFANYKTTPDEFAVVPHADIGIVNSNINKLFLSKEGFPDKFMRLGPALRYRYLEPLEQSLNQNVLRENVLIALPISFEGACELLEMCSRAIKQKNLKIFIKAHPMTNALLLKEMVSFVWPDNFVLVEGSMEQWLNQVKIVIVSDSSVMVESVAKNIHTIVVGKETDIDIIPLDVLGQSMQLWTMVYDTVQLSNAFARFYYEQPVSGLNTNQAGFFEFDMGLLDEIFNENNPRRLRRG